MHFYNLLTIPENLPTRANLKGNSPKLTQYLQWGFPWFGPWKGGHQTFSYPSHGVMQYRFVWVQLSAAVGARFNQWPFVACPGCAPCSQLCLPCPGHCSILFSSKGFFPLPFLWQTPPYTGILKKSGESGGNPPSHSGCEQSGNRNFGILHQDTCPLSVGGKQWPAMTSSFYLWLLCWHCRPGQYVATA